MYLKPSFQDKQLTLGTRTGQQGSSLVIAIFILVVMLLLGVALTRVLSTSSETIAYEVVGARAYQAANIGLQRRLTELFPLNETANYCNGDDIAGVDPDGNAIVINNDYLTSISSVPGLNTCQVVEMQCTDFKVDDVVYYRLTSTGQCGVGDDTVSRVVEVEARSL